MAAVIQPSGLLCTMIRYRYNGQFSRTRLRYLPCSAIVYRNEPGNDHSTVCLASSMALMLVKLLGNLVTATSQAGLRWRTKSPPLHRLIVTHACSQYRAQKPKTVRKGNTPFACFKALLGLLTPIAEATGTDGSTTYIVYMYLVTHDGHHLKSAQSAVKAT